MLPGVDSGVGTCPWSPLYDALCLAVGVVTDHLQEVSSQEEFSKVDWFSGVYLCSRIFGSRSGREEMEVWLPVILEPRPKVRLFTRCER